MTTDGSSVAAAPPGPRCSLPPGWRPRPINPKPCHLFSSSWIQKRVPWRLLYRALQPGCTPVTGPLSTVYVLGDRGTTAVATGSGLGDMWGKKAVGYSCECLNWFRSQQKGNLSGTWLCNKQQEGNMMKQRMIPVNLGSSVILTCIHHSNCWDLATLLQQTVKSSLILWIVL